MSGGCEIKEVRSMDNVVWKNSTVFTTFNNEKYFYIDSKGYYRYRNQTNIYCIAYKSNIAVNEFYYMKNGALQKLNPQIFAETNNIKIIKAPVNIGIQIYANQIRINNLNTSLKQVLISEDELTKQDVINYFKNIT